uniref:Glycosyltransferase RgtA/B/C/D-like domain-containing protein n=1 Tax=Ignisphaera aggregans TaxID=334771 RepID=A0A7C5XKI1_9CREN
MQISESFLRIIKKPVIKFILIITLYDILIFSLFLVINPNILDWLFDDKYVINNELIYYVDFRPGYPPIGKLPYTFLYKVFGNAESIVLYNLIMTNLTLIILYKLLKEVTSRRKAIILTSIVALQPVLIWSTIFSTHADTVALFWLILTIYYIKAKNPLGVGLSAALGFLTKIYNAILMIPAFVLFKGRERVVLVSSFITIIILMSAPYLSLDPLMYITTYLHHLSRGPSESIFALLDGYYSHTGFPHPTFEAMIYAWQFNAIYTPSNIDHFNYAWNYPQLRYISSTLQIFFLLLFSILLSKMRHEIEVLKTTSLAALSYFVFSAFWNPPISLPTFILVTLTTLDVKTLYQVLILACFMIIDLIHAAIWIPGSPIDICVGLLVVTISRALLISTALYITTKIMR